MPRIFIISVVLFYTCKMYCQTTLNDSLLYYEYIYFKSNDDAVKQKALFKKINLYLQHDITGDAVLKEIKRVDKSALTHNKLSFLWNASAIAYLNEDINYANASLNEYIELKKDTSITFNLLALLVYKSIDSLAATKRIAFLSQHDTLFKSLTCFNNAGNYNRKHLNLYLASSALIPGSGTIMNGEVLKGLTSMALSTLSVYGVYKLLEYGLYINAILWGTGVGLKFYAGNIKLTEKAFYTKENNKKNKLTNTCELKLKNILDKYPITLQEL